MFWGQREGIVVIIVVVVVVQVNSKSLGYAPRQRALSRGHVPVMPTRGAWGSPTTRFVTRQRAPQAGNSLDVQAPLPYQTAEGRPAQR